MYAGSTAPSGWLLCDGSAVSRTTYATLFAVIGTTYGTGDGSTTFNLPNLTDRFPIGAGSTYSLNATGGSANAIIPYHSHTATGGAVEDKAAYDATLKTSGSVNSTNSSHAHTVSGRSVYNGTSNYVALTSNANRSTLYNSMDEGGSHTHSFTNPVYTIGKHGHSFTQPTISYEGKNADGTDASADNTANANLPPYIGINFIISTGD